MGNVITLDIELRCPVHGLLQDAEKFRCDLFAARYRRFDSGSCESSGRFFELVQNFGYFHASYRITLVLPGARASVLP
jgi:hypothetical protein